MSNLLQVIRFKPQALKKKSNYPLMVDVPVDDEAAPFLVSSSKGGYLWIEKAHPGNMIKAAVQDIATPGQVFYEVLDAVIQRGAEEKWGNVHPYTEEGLKEAIKYLEFYGLTDVELLVSRSKSEKNSGSVRHRPEWLTTKKFDYPIHPTSWLPDNCIVVVPSDRGFVGTIAHFAPKKIIVAVHNPSRGLAVVKG